MTAIGIHLISAHLPLGGGAVLLGLVVASLRDEIPAWRRACCGVAIAVALAAVASMTSGPSAQVAVEPWLDPEALAFAERHETVGRVAAYLWVGSAALAVVAASGVADPGAARRRVQWGLLAIVTVAFVVSLLAGATGGRIRHDELRSDSPPVELQGARP